MPPVAVRRSTCSALSRGALGARPAALRTARVLLRGSGAAIMSTAMNFGSKSFQPRPPDTGSFPLDHFGERRATAGLLRRVSGRGSPPVAPCGPVGAGVRARLQVGKLRPAAAHSTTPEAGLRDEGRQVAEDVPRESVAGVRGTRAQPRTKPAGC